MSPDEIVRALDAKAKAHDVFSLAVALAERDGEPRSDRLVFHNQDDRAAKILEVINGGLSPIGLPAIVRTDHGFVCGFRRFTNEALGRSLRCREDGEVCLGRSCRVNFGLTS